MRSASHPTSKGLDIKIKISYINREFIQVFFYLDYATMLVIRLLNYSRYFDVNLIPLRAPKTLATPLASTHGPDLHVPEKDVVF